MGFLWFYASVFRVAFSHSRDIAQAIIFVLLIISGAAIYERPDLKMIIGGIDISGWQVGVYILGGIVAVRLIAAPYWLWRETYTRLVPENSIDFGFRFTGLGLR